MRTTPVRAAVAHIARRVLPRDIPTAALLRPQRAILAVHGPDAAKFLNGLLTVRPPDSTRPDEPAGTYAGLLNAKGRVLADLFAYAVHQEDWVARHLTDPQGSLCYLLDVHRGVEDRVLNMLRFYKLMSDVTIEQVPTLESWVGWSDLGSDTPSQEELDSLAPPERAAVIALGAGPRDALDFADFRVQSLGRRLVVPEGQLGTPDFEADATLQTSYDVRRYLFGVPEGPDEFLPEKSLPLEFCMDFMNGVDFNKGCYVGQELTIRTFHHGVIRKRVVPVVFTKMDAPLPESMYEPIDYGVDVTQPILDKVPLPGSEGVADTFAGSPGAPSASSPFGASARPNRPAGALVGVLGNVGLASLRLDKLGHKFSVTPPGADEPVEVHPLSPYWWPENIPVPN